MKRDLALCNRERLSVWIMMCVSTSDSVHEQLDNELPS